MSSTRFKSQLEGLLGKHQKLLQELLQNRLLLRGSFNEVHTRCGKSNCWCAQSQQAHSHARLTWSQDGELITRKVPSEQIHRVRQLTRNYRKFRLERRRLASLQQRIQQALDEYENALLQETSQPLDFLASAPKMSVRSRTRREKGRGKGGSFS